MHKRGLGWLYVISLYQGQNVFQDYTVNFKSTDLNARSSL